MALLHTENLSVTFGGLKAVDDVSMDIYLIEFRRLIAQGTSAQRRSDDKVIAAYLAASVRKDAQEAKAALAQAEPGGQGQT